VEKPWDPFGLLQIASTPVEPCRLEPVNSALQTGSHLAHVGTLGSEDQSRHGARKTLSNLQHPQTKSTEHLNPLPFLGETSATSIR
jgi:hypothetical protein